MGEVTPFGRHACPAPTLALPPDVAGPVDPVDETLRWLRASREPQRLVLDARWRLRYTRFRWIDCWRCWG